MIVLALVMAGGVFFVASAAAREVRVAELKSNFVASVSHDLKTPLALIQLFAETLELGRVRNAERAQEYYRIINTEARKLTRLIENILDFSRMEAGLRPYRLAPVDIGDLTRHALSEMESQFAQTQFTIDTQIEPGLPRLEADEDAVERAIENLLANAMKYSGESRDDRGQGRPRQRSRLRRPSAITASASRGASSSGSSASSIVSTAASAAARRAAAWGWPSSTTPCAATAASCRSTASPIAAARSRCTFPFPRPPPRRETDS